MIDWLRRLPRVVPSLALSFALAMAVWISAVTSADPNEELIFPRPLTVEMVGQDPGVILVDEDAFSVTMTINAPRSIWQRLTSEDGLVRAVADLSGLGPGTHEVEVQALIGVRPAERVSISPRFINVNLEPLSTRSIPISLLLQGEPAIGFQVEDATLSQETALVSGPDSQVAQVEMVRATVNLGNAHENINTTVALQALDLNEGIIERVTLNPERITVMQPITQRGGFRSDLVVRPIYTGQLADGYRLTSVSVFPPAVTVFSSDPRRVNELPGYIETAAINLQDASDDLEVLVSLNLPTGVTLVGEQQVTVQVGIAAIESSIGVPGQLVEPNGLEEGLEAIISPRTLDLILSGPVPILDRLASTDIRVFVDLSGLPVGLHQVAPQVELPNGEITVISIMPATLEVEIRPTPTPVVPTPTRRP